MPVPRTLPRLAVVAVLIAGTLAALVPAAANASGAEPCPNPLISPSCAIGETVGKAANDLATDTINTTLLAPLSVAVTAAAKTLLNLFLMVWLDFSSFDLREQGALQLYGLTLFIGWLIGAVLLMWQSIRTMIMGKGTPLLEAVQGLVVTALVAMGGVGVTGMLMEGSDALSRWILGDLAKNGLLKKELEGMLTGSGLSAWLTIQISILLILVLIIQLLVLFLRNATAPLLAILLPIAAAGQVGGTSTRQWLPRMISAVVAVVCYKPMVSLIIVAAVAQIRDSTELPGLLYGLLMFLLSVIAMPALMKVFAPLGTAAAGGGAGALSMASSLLQLSKSGGSEGGAHGAAPTSAADHAQAMQQSRQHTVPAENTTSAVSTGAASISSTGAASAPPAESAGGAAVPAAPSTSVNAEADTAQAAGAQASTAGGGAAGASAVPVAGAVIAGAQAVERGVDIATGHVTAPANAAADVGADAGVPTGAVRADQRGAEEAPSVHPLERESASPGNGELSIDDRTYE